MSGLSINSLNNYYSSSYAQNNASAAQTDFQNLGQALQSGNISAAQTAFAALQETYQGQSPASSSSSSSSQSPSTSNPITTDLNALASALSSGNLSTAQSAYTQLQKDMQTQGSGHHHHHHGGGMGGAVQSLISQLSSSSSTGSSTSGSSGTLDVQA